MFPRFIACFVPSRAGKSLILLQGYTYRQHIASGGGKVRWMCSTGGWRGCRAVVFTVGDRIVSIKNEHDHEPPNYKLPR